MGLGYLSARQDEPTVREQRDIEQALPRFERTVGALSVAAGPDAVLEFAPPRLDRGCRITPMRDGAVLTQRLTVRTVPADGPALFDRIAAELPTEYAATAWHSADGQVHELRADGGEFIAVTGRLAEPGRAVLTVTTGCRPIRDNTDPTTEFLSRLPADDGPDRVGEPDRVLAALDATDVQPVERVGVPCPGDGVAYTVRSSGRGEPPASPATALAPLAGANALVVVNSPQLYAYRSGPLSVVVEATDGTIRVAVTRSCQP